MTEPAIGPAAALDDLQGDCLPVEEVMLDGEFFDRFRVASGDGDPEHDQWDDATGVGGRVSQ
ncbi:hypothetical protein ABZ299_19250 [Streptomyces sp. NPDC006184]|uniref:hypothetical protein n=1 Tax=unclassified Streptomyces TaxID=2593676 RepID=UPI0033A0F70B